MREIHLATTTEDHRIAALAALAIGLSLAEAALPSPIPGVKPGLANIVVLLVMKRHGLNAAVWVAVIRLLASSILLGFFLAPGFWLASVGAFASLLVMAAACRLPSRWFGVVSVSILMAFAHIVGQLWLAKYWLFSEANLLLLMPVFAFSALLFGTVNGLIVARLVRVGGQWKEQGVTERRTEEQNAKERSDVASEQSDVASARSDVASDATNNAQSAHV